MLRASFVDILVKYFDAKAFGATEGSMDGSRLHISDSAPPCCRQGREGEKLGAVVHRGGEGVCEVYDRLAQG